MNLLITLAEETIEKLLPHISLSATLATVKNALATLLSESDESLSSLFATATSEEFANIKASIAHIIGTPAPSASDVVDNVAPVSEAVAEVAPVSEAPVAS